MGKGIIFLLGLISLGACTAYLGKQYADQGIEKYYQVLNRAEKNYELKLDQFEMGSLQGKASWSLKVILNPCHADGTLNFIGHDVIDRDWKGYRIRSELRLVNNYSKWKSLKSTPIYLDQTMNWMGVVQSKIEIPEIKNLPLWKGGTLSVSKTALLLNSMNQDGRLRFEQANLTIPQMVIEQTGRTTHIEGVEWQTNQGLNQHLFEPGEMQLKIQQLKFENYGENYYNEVSVSHLNQSSLLMIQDQMVSLKMGLNIQKIEESNQRPLENIVVQGTLGEINRSKISQAFKVLEQGYNSCAAYENIKNDFEQSFMTVLNDGMIFNLSENQLQYDGQQMNLNMNGKVMQNFEQSTASFMSALPRLIDADLKTQFDPKIFSMILFSPSKIASATGVDSESSGIQHQLTQLESEKKLTRQGRLVLINKRYLLGEFH